MGIADKIIELKSTLPDGCKLVAVSKTKTKEMIQEAYEAGHKDFGENKVQELAEKAELLPKDINWHMIGHLQRNKVKYLASFVHLIHGVDSLKLLKEINKQAAKNDRIINCLLQIHIAKEETKFGLSPSELEELLSSGELTPLANVKIIGLMGMATNTDDSNQVLAEFNGLKALFDKIKSQPQTDSVAISQLSMGMSSDYLLAIEASSTLIRVGSKIFGERIKDTL